MDNNIQQVPYIVYESMIAKEERTQKKLIIVIVLLIILLAACNGFWAYEWTQFDYVTTDEVKMDSQGSGVNNYIGNDGDITNGSNDSETHQGEDKK